MTAHNTPSDMTLCGKNITKTYGKQTVLNNLNITIQSGCIYGLIGRNGIGKTTLLGILTGQNTLDSGEVTYGDMPVWENRNALQYICFSRELSPTMGAGQNPLKAKEYLRAAAIYYPLWDKAYAATLIEKFGLNIKKRLSQLSKGQLSMLTIIIALASGAPLTILDEPVAGLDVVARELFYRLLLENYAQTNRTFIISTHIIEEAASVFERVLIMDKGTVIEDLPTEEFTGAFRAVSGSVEEVSNALSQVPSLAVLSTQTLGKHKMVTVRGDETSFAALESTGLHVAPVSLQNAFLALCGDHEIIKEA